MRRIVYSAWDGLQDPFSLKKKEIVDAFMENIMKGMTPNMALAQMLWDGFSGMNFRVMGLEEMLQEIQQQMNELYEKYNLDHAFDMPKEALEHLLGQEAMARQQTNIEPPPSFWDLPPGLLEKFRSLDNFPWADPDAMETFEEWRGREQDMLDLYEFYAQHGRKFTGEESLDFEEALELMRQMQSLEALQQQLLNGEFEQVDMQSLKEMLGDEATRSLMVLIRLPEMMTQEGIVEFSRKGFDMTPRGIRNLGELAFGKLYYQAKQDKQGGHLGNAPQSGEIEPDTSRRYQYGDRFDLDITRTILGAVQRRGRADDHFKLSPDDFYVRDREQLITSTTVMLLDLSWSMSWEGRFQAAKKVALALDHYVRSRFPRDKFHIVGFSTEARELKGKDLALAIWDRGQAYTNLQGALRLAMNLIKRSGNRNNRVIVITDGQPTAYYHGEHLHIELPNGMFGISPNACKATLAEVRKVTSQGMNIDTFMLDDNPVLVEFIRQISRINKGRAIICVPGDLGNLVMVEEIKRRERRA